jgi:hypothetical protein
VRFLVLYLGMCLLTVSPLRAQDRAAGKTRQTATASTDPLEIGKAAYADGRYADALRAFEESYKHVKRPRTLYRIGDSADKLGQHTRTVEVFEEYLRVEPAAADRVFIESRIAANRQQAAAAGSGEPAPAPIPAATRAETKPQPSAAPAKPPADLAAPAAAVAADGSSKPNGADDGGLKPWWIIAGAGTLVVAGIMVIALTVGASSSHSTPPPVKGNIGGSVQTLRGP